ncbi:transposase [Streptomyces sp. NPDC048564]|uniref:transposase n=1 Tax=Streptomyces sp. NPDC048564 TaxID=3155760 RepID=UPI0034484BAD
MTCAGLCGRCSRSGQRGVPRADGILCGTSRASERAAGPGHLASAAGLVPVLRDSGRRTGNRLRRYSPRLRRVVYMSAQTSIVRDGPNRHFYLRGRGEGLKHARAVIALARRRAGVLKALLRDDRVCTSAPPVTQAA